MEIIFFQKFSSSAFQYSERTIASAETNNTSAESPRSQLLFGTLKNGWHGQEGATLSRCEKHRSVWGKKSYFRAGGRGSLMVMPYPLLGCQIKAEIKDFLLKYCLFQYKYWFFPNFELKDFPEYTFTPYNSYRS